MRVQDDHIEETVEEARGAENIKGMTTVLRLSMGLAVLAMAVVLLFYVFG